MTLTRTRRPYALALLGALLAALLMPLTVSTAPSAEAVTSITRGIKITKVTYNPAGDERFAPNGEKVYIKNVTSTSKNLRNVVLSDLAGHRYTLPSYTLGAGRTVIVHSGSGTNGSGHIYARWNTAVWNNTGDTARLRAADGTWIHRCSWSGGGVSVTC